MLNERLSTIKRDRTCILSGNWMHTSLRLDVIDLSGPPAKPYAGNGDRLTGRVGLMRTNAQIDKRTEELTAINAELSAVRAERERIEAEIAHVE